jgi:hypothetical protein
MLIVCTKNLNQSDLTDCKIITIKGEKRSIFSGEPGLLSRLYGLILSAPIFVEIHGWSQSSPEVEKAGNHVVPAHWPLGSPKATCFSFPLTVQS